MFATYTDLVTKYGAKEVDEVSQYSTFNSGLNEYVTVVDRPLLQLRAIKALEEAAIILRSKLACHYDLTEIDAAIVEGKTFPILRMYQTKLAYLYLKENSDCDACKEHLCAFDSMCKCALILDSEGVALSKDTGFVVEEIEDCIPKYCFKCNSNDCTSCSNCTDVAPTE